MITIIYHQFKLGVLIKIPFHRVGLLESAVLSGWYTSSKAKY